MELLKGWDNFCVILGSATAGLMGLTFVVIALASDARRASHPSGTRGYITPTIVHFGIVLAVCIVMSLPGLRTSGLSLALAAGGVLGLLYTCITVFHVLRFATNYKPVVEDWIWHVLAPIAAYGCLLATSVIVRKELSTTMYEVAAVLTILLFIAIHNAWDVAVSIAAQKQKSDKE
jgi:hypothetical protein